MSDHCAPSSTRVSPPSAINLALMPPRWVIVPRRDGKNNYYTLTDTGVELAMVVKELM